MRRRVNFRLCRDHRRGESPPSFLWYGRAKTRVPAQCKPCPNGYSPLQKQSCAPQGGLGEKEFSDGNFVQHRKPSKTLKIKCFTNCQSFALAAPEPPPRGGRFASHPSVRARRSLFRSPHTSPAKCLRIPRSRLRTVHWTVQSGFAGPRLTPANAHHRTPV